MTPQRKSASTHADGPKSPNRPLLTWPIALIAVTLAMFLITNTVSAWGSRKADGVDDFKQHAEHFVDRMLRKIDATGEQTAAIQQIIGGTIEELAAAHEQRGNLHDEISALLTAETIDREALEAMRADQLARADQMSRIATESLADAMEVLTVEQRTELEKRIAKHRRHHGRHGHGAHGSH